MVYTINKKKIAKNTIALYVRMGITMVISFFTARITLEQLGVSDYGLNNLVGSIVSMLTFLNGSMGTAVQRYYSYELGKGNSRGLKKIFSVGLTLHALVAVVTLVAAELFAIFFLVRMNIPIERQFAAKVVFQISIFSLIINIINVPYAALLRSREMFSQVAIVEIIQSVLRLIVLYLLVILEYDKLVTLSLLNFVITIYYICAITILARKFEETHAYPSWDKKLVNKMLSFISILIVTVLANLLQIQGVAFLINLFFTLAINAAYGIAVQVFNLVNNFVSSFKVAVVPQMMSSYGSGDLKNMHNLIDMGTKISFILLMLVTMPVVFEINFLLKLWLGTPPQYTAEFIILTLVYLNISSFTYFHYQGVHATGYIMQQQLLMSLLYILNVIFVYISFKIGYSFFFELYINIFFAVLQCIINLYCAKRKYNYNITTFVKSLMIPCILSVTIICLLLMLIKYLIQSYIEQFVIVVLASVFLTVILSYKLILNASERKKCVSIISHRILKTK